jgi:hypothetical protein
MIMSAEGKEQARKWRDGLDEGVVTMEGLAPVLRYDFALCEAMIGEAERFRSIGEVENRDVLLLGGEVSLRYIREALRVFAGVVIGNGKRVKRVEVKGVGHELLENKIRNGKVGLGVGVIRQFLSSRPGAVE